MSNNCRSKTPPNSKCQTSVRSKHPPIQSVKKVSGNCRLIFKCPSHTILRSPNLNPQAASPLTPDRLSPAIRYPSPPRTPSTLTRTPLTASPNLTPPPAPRPLPTPLTSTLTPPTPDPQPEGCYMGRRAGGKDTLIPFRVVI